ncbi:MAG: hypothetical protein AB8B56_09565 [Crocinitomicaceae bacterium]
MFDYSIVRLSDYPISFAAVCWIVGLSDYSIVRSSDLPRAERSRMPDLAIVGLLDCWIVGLLDCWIVGLLRLIQFVVSPSALRSNNPNAKHPRIYF